MNDAVATLGSSDYFGRFAISTFFINDVEELSMM